jgi:hypothetical protein
MKAPPRSSAGRAPQLTEALARHQSSWAPVFVARATLGLPSVLVVPEDVAGAVALVSPAEASAWLKQRGDAKAAAKVVGTATPGSAWAVAVTPEGAVVSPVAVAPFLAG